MSEHSEAPMRGLTITVDGDEIVYLERGDVTIRVAARRRGTHVKLTIDAPKDTKILRSRHKLAESANER